MAHYVDTSALVKLVVAEPETPTLLTWLGAGDRRPVASDLVRTELQRAVRCVAPDRMPRARAVLDAVTLIEVTAPIFEQAGRLEPAALRSLDALHLATALDIGDDLDGLVTYDDRLAEAARLNGVPVVMPG